MISGVDIGKLNDAAIRRWLKGGITRDFRDLRFPELRLRANAGRAKASVFLVLNVGGETKWEKIATWPSVCIKTLTNDLPVMLAKRSIGNMVIGQFESLGDLLNWYQSHIKNNSTYSASWRSNVASLIKCHLMPRLGMLRLSEVSFVEIDTRLVKTMLQDEFSPNYIREAVNKLKVAFAAAAKLRLLNTNPIAGYQVTDSIKLDGAKDTRLFETDLSELFARLSVEIMPVQMLFVLMMMFGTRINETRQARWEYFAGGTWVIPASHVKNKQEHRLPLTDSARSLLKRYKQWQFKHVGKRAYLFPGMIGPISIRTAHKWNTHIRFKHFTSHDLRILFRTMLADLGVDTMIGERLVNHALPVLLRTYVKSTLDKGMSQALEQYHAYLIDQGFSSVAPEILPRSSVDHGTVESQMASGWV
ncbi:tyrosine-type recombinase/integrase [Shewanella psychropiezotolerans]|uniref:Tyrosine-type recombinase/integrase n=1 Tax=Shewanella psychropiezotolerans TaxID=2593655 RepID=A0ABX5WZK4_9GAMM|nr:tyrosine-type recombinase/integrase [Shewanella psychropiezotolerans]QDO84524.1 tyrosine-type recombinase/integrase [Shewanella psychropiezotolerans]